jgi:trehalose-6-phosphatase
MYNIGPMKTYSTPAQIDHFLEKIGRAPLFVCDMDGNVMTGYSLRSNGPVLALSENDDAKRQAIPYGLSRHKLNELVGKGVLEEGIFADKAMDARLPEELVDLVNSSIGDFKIAFLTSRGANDARQLLKESGVTDVDRVTLVADSGATLYIAGDKTEARILNEEEKLFLSNLDVIAENLQSHINLVMNRYAEYDPLRGATPSLFVEHKGIATNIHYREILSHFGAAENSRQDKALAAALRNSLQSYIDVSEHIGVIPKGAFKLLDGPATIEVKVSDVNKGHGLAAIVEAVLKSDRRPTAIVFTGDDVAKGNGTPGTDYYAMVEARNFAARYALPFFNIHTHHPIGNDVNGTIPDPNKSPTTLSASFNKPDIDLVVPTPAVLKDIILKAQGRDNREDKVAALPAPVPGV